MSGQPFGREPTLSLGTRVVILYVTGEIAGPGRIASYTEEFSNEKRVDVEWEKGLITNENTHYLRELKEVG